MLLLHFWGVATDGTMLSATSLNVAAYDEDGRRYEGPDATLSHGVLDASTPDQVRRSDYNERHRECREKPTNPERSSHARISVRGLTLEFTRGFGVNELLGVNLAGVPGRTLSDDRRLCARRIPACPTAYRRVLE